MRISVLPDDLGYASFQRLFHAGKRVKVFTRSCRLRRVLTADDAEGLAVVIAEPPRIALNVNGVHAVVTAEVREDIFIEVVPS